MSAIKDSPNTYDFGYDFNYANWSMGTEVNLVNVPWNNNYRDIVKFDSKAALDTYIDSLETAGISLDNISYLKTTIPIRLDIPFNVAYAFNYLRAKNPLQPITGDVVRNYYYFINDVNYIAPNTTEFVIQLDVWQTFGYDVQFGNSYVERGHIGIANSNAFDNHGRDYLTVPEGIDTGSEYQVATVKHEQISAGSNDYDIMAVSAVDLTADAGTVSSPNLVSAGGSVIQSIVSGADIYVWHSSSDFTRFLQANADKPWVTQSILAVYLIPAITRYYPDFAYAADAPTFGTRVNEITPGISPTHTIFPGWRDSTEILNLIPERYRGLRKLFTYPYMVIELTTWSATPIILKPESWADDDATVREFASLVPGSQRVAFIPAKYNRNPDSIINPVPNGSDDDGGEYLDLMSIITNFVTVPIVNDMAISYLASNKNGIAFQYSSADWSQQRALRGNSISYDQASSAIDLSRNLNRLNVAGSQSSTANQNLAISQGVSNNMVFGALSNVLGGGMAGAKGGPMGVAAGVAGGVANAIPSTLANQASAGVAQDLNTRQNSLQNIIANTTNNAATRQQSYIRDTNKDLADWGARGDYENSVAGINAKVNDSRMIQPSTNGQFGGDAFNLINTAYEVSLRWKMLDNASMTIVGEYWLRYGYAIHKFMQIPSTLMVMSKFTYWKLTESYILTSAMPESFKQIIRGIFEKGVTVWKTPSDIGQIDIADNVPLEGISY